VETQETARGRAGRSGMERFTPVLFLRETAMNHGTRRSSPMRESFPAIPTAANMLVDLHKHGETGTRDIAFDAGGHIAASPRRPMLFMGGRDIPRPCHIFIAVARSIGAPARYVRRLFPPQGEGALRRRRRDEGAKMAGQVENQVGGPQGGPQVGPRLGPKLTSPPRLDRLRSGERDMLRTGQQYALRGSRLFGAAVRGAPYGGGPRRWGGSGFEVTQAS